MNNDTEKLDKQTADNLEDAIGGLGTELIKQVQASETIWEEDGALCKHAYLNSSEVTSTIARAFNTLIEKVRAATATPVTGSRPEVMRLVNEALESMNEAGYQLAERILRSVSAAPVTRSREGEIEQAIQALHDAHDPNDKAMWKAIEGLERALAAAPVAENGPAEALLAAALHEALGALKKTHHVLGSIYESRDLAEISYGLTDAGDIIEAVLKKPARAAAPVVESRPADGQTQWFLTADRLPTDGRFYEVCCFDTYPIGEEHRYTPVEDAAYDAERTGWYDENCNRVDYEVSAWLYKPKRPSPPAAPQPIHS